MLQKIGGLEDRVRRAFRIASILALGVVVSLGSMTPAASWAHAFNQEPIDGVSVERGLASAVSDLLIADIITSLEDLRPLDSITRAEAVTMVVRALGLDADARRFAGASIFSDCDPEAWYSGYFTIAAVAGIVSGSPGDSVRPLDLLTVPEMQAMLVRAVGRTTQAEDSGGYPVGYTAVANELGLTLTQFHTTGEDSEQVESVGTLSTSSPILRGEFILLLHRAFYQVPSATGVTMAIERGIGLAGTRLVVHESAAEIHQGDVVFFSAEALGPNDRALNTGPLLWSCDKGEIRNGRYLATESGYATIAVRSGKLQASRIIYINGDPARLEVSAPQSVVANGVDRHEVAVRVVDEQGNPVKDFDGIITLGYAQGGSNGTVRLVGNPSARAEQGEASFTLVSGTNSPARDSIELGTEGIATRVETIAAVPQTPTSIGLYPEVRLLPVNEATKSVVRAAVLDQSGAPMVSGAFEIALGVEGQGTIADSVALAPDGTFRSYYLGSDRNRWAAFSVSTIKGETGPLRVTASAEGLPSTTTTLEGVVAGSPHHLVVNVDRTTLTAADWGTTGIQHNAEAHIVIELVDRYGTPVPAESDISIDVSYDEALTGSISFLPSEVGVLIAEGSFRAELGVTISRAGRWAVELSDRTREFPANPLEFEVIAGPAAMVALVPADLDGDNLITPGSDWVAVGGSPVILMASVVDRYGNELARENLPVRFRVSSYSEPRGEAILNDYTSDVIAVTGPQGTAKVSFEAVPYHGDIYQVTSMFDADSNGTFEALSQSAFLKVVDGVPNEVRLVTRDTQGNIAGSVAANAGNYLTVTARVTDQNGHPGQQGYRVLFSVVSGGGVFSADSALTDFAGYASTTFIPDRSGTSQLTARVVNAYPEVGASQAVLTRTGDPALLQVRNAKGGTEAVAIETAGIYGPYSLEVTDAKGNPTAATREIVVAPVDLARLFGASFTYRLSPTGLDVDTAILPAGSRKADIYVVAHEGQTIFCGSRDLSKVGPPIPAVVTGVADEDQTDPGATGTDISIYISESPSSDFAQYDVYLLPAGVDLTDSHAPIVTLLQQAISRWQGMGSLTNDSGGTPLGSGGVYRIWLVTVDSDGLEASAASQPFEIVAEP